MRPGSSDVTRVGSAARPDAPRTDRPDGPRSRRRRLAVALPLLLAALAVLTLTGLDLNGSSIGRLSATPRHDSALISGHPLGIRSDEWNLTTPNLVGNVRRGLPARPWIGLTPTFVPGSPVGIPSRHWSTVFRPQDWSYFMPGLGLPRAFALRWWMPLLIAFAGCYALLLLLSRSVTVSAGLAMTVTFAPVTAWWSQGPAMAIGFLAGALAAVLLATTRRRWWASVAWGAVAGWLAVADVLLIYPPWQIPLAWVCAAVGVGWLLDLRPRASRVVAGLGAFVIVTVGALGAWYAQSREALLATANTSYPGHRVAAPGGGSLAWLMDAPSTIWMSMGKGSLLPDDHTMFGDPLPMANPSEISSAWIPLPLLAVAALVIVWSIARVRSRAGSATVVAATVPSAAGIPSATGTPSGTGTPAGEGHPGGEDRPLVWTGLASVMVTLLLLAWMLLPLPSTIGAVTLLNQATGRRMPVPLALATVVVLASATTVLRRVGRPRWLWPVAVVGTLATVWAVVWAVDALPWRSARTAPPSGEVAVVALVLAVGAGLLVVGRLRRTAALGLGLLALVTYLPVNPVYRGLGPLDHDPVVKTLVPMVKADQGLRAVAYGHSSQLTPLVTASGAQTLSGLTIYPDRDVWEKLAPDQERSWNRYSKYDWIVDPTATRPLLHGVSGTQQDFRVDPCSAAIRQLDIDVSLSPDPIDVPCLALDRVITRGSQKVYLYRYR
jgi:hypothetical protein